jgi:molecular chaperone DnaK
MDKLLLGIDFGTSTNFVTKYDFDKKNAVAVANMGGYAGSNIFDNCIYIESENNLIIGDKKKYIQYPENSFQDIKRFIVSDQWRHQVPNLNYREVTAMDIAEMIFKSIKQKVEKNEARSIDGAVITVPYAYSDVYKNRIKEAAEKAGIPVIKLVEEPVAAAISFGIFSDRIPDGKKEKIVVFDLGGGTFDITVFQFKKDDKQHATIEVLNTDGVEKLGGKTIDGLFSDKLRNNLDIEYIDFPEEKEKRKFQQTLIDVASREKELLSSEEEVDIFEPLTVNKVSRELELIVKREEFNSWLKDNNIVGQIQDALYRSLDAIDLEPKDIDRIVLAGGSSSIPLIYQIVEDFFGKKPESRQNLGELVGHGAGIVAGLSADNSLHYEVIRKTSKDIGIASSNKFKRILYKNWRYNQESSPISVNLSNKDTASVVFFYEGDSSRIESCERIGKCTINSRNFLDGKVQISLMRDEDTGRLKYIFRNSNHDIVSENFMQDLDA